MASGSAMIVAEPNLFGIGLKNWAIAEESALEILRNIHPTSVSEASRRNVANFVQKLIWDHLGVMVLPYGSVPFKTYLPEGDIDFTAFCGANEDVLAGEVKSVLQKAERNATSEFVVKDVQLISAKVKLVKCMVQKIVVDISFNQTGGLSALCFLEQIDRLIGRDHLFKQSIMLIKSWSYYESRVLGAQHGLISTYALETLVLHIFNLYHSTLHGPLAVLHKFLDYFSKFDWETFCVSLNGPVRLSSLPDVKVEMPEDTDGDLLLKSSFLSTWIDIFSAPSGDADMMSCGFKLKHLNIIDPLKEANNLGCSVSKGNFYRIRSAFTYGARRLGWILSQPENFVATELNKFFSNTMPWHGGEHRPQDFDPLLPCHRFMVKVPLRGSPLCTIDNFTHEDSNEHTLQFGDFPPCLCKLSHDVSRGCEASEKQDGCSMLMNSRMLILDYCHDKVPKSLNSLIDLTGDYESYFQWFNYGRWYNQNAFHSHSLSMLSSTTTLYQNTELQFKQCGFSNHPDGFHPHTEVYATQNPIKPGAAIGYEEMLKNQGTRTFITDMNHFQNVHKPTAMDRKEEATSPSGRCIYVRNLILQELKIPDRSSQEVSKQDIRVSRNVSFGSCNRSQLFCAGSKGYLNANGSVSQLS